MDARAAMALYRLHKKIWDKDYVPLIHMIKHKPSRLTANDELRQSETDKAADSKRKPAVKAVGEGDTAVEKKNGVGRRVRGPKKQGISSGLSVVMKTRNERRGESRVVSGTRNQAKNIPARPADGNWWTTLGKY
jgi:RNA exonuclease 4